MLERPGLVAPCVCREQTRLFQGRETGFEMIRILVPNGHLYIKHQKICEKLFRWHLGASPGNPHRRASNMLPTM